MSERWSQYKVEQEIAKREHASWSTHEGFETWRIWQRAKTIYERVEDVMASADARGVSYEQAGVYGFMQFMDENYLHSSAIIPEVGGLQRHSGTAVIDISPIVAPTVRVSHTIPAGGLQAASEIHPDHGKPLGEEVQTLLAGGLAGNNALNHVGGVVSDAAAHEQQELRTIDIQIVQERFGE